MPGSSKRSFSVGLLVLGLGLATYAPARGASRPPHLASPRVHPETTTLFAYRARTGRTFPTFRRNEVFERTGRMPVVVRWLAAPDATKREHLARKGVFFERDEPIASGAWLVTVTEEGLGALASDAEVARVTVDMFRQAPLPLTQSQEETGARTAARAAMAKSGAPLDGSGIVIADIDTPLYLHHPAFFRADGGAFAWVDVDGNGALTPGKDGVDLDASGTIEASEVLHDLRSIAISHYSREIIENHTTFQPDLDYLYLDTNGNGVRDHGEGFDESTPAYGEPLFVFDDANHDSRTQLTERVIQLKSSKVKAVGSKNKTFTRGKSGATGLIAYDADTDPDLSPLMGHATAVAGILAGGQPGISRWVGLAPAADLILNDGTGQRGQVAAVQWAIDRKPNVILTEYAPYTGVSLDGSSEDETILDAATDAGIVTVSPAGNLATGRKHRTVTLQPGSQKIGLNTEIQSRMAALSLHYRGAERKLGLQLRTSSGLSIDLPESAPDGVAQPDGTLLYVLAQTTPRGTHERFVYLLANEPMFAGTYELTATLDGAEPLELDLFAADEITSWAGGFMFDEQTPARTICNPSTSDKTISVAAYVLHEDLAYGGTGPTGSMATYSSQGPRLDGTPGIEIAAPDNPISTAPPDKSVDGIVWEPFGGTSGAGPHVAAGVALLAQAFPNESAAELKERVLRSAKPGDADVNLTGRGKLDIAGAVGATIASGAPPQVNLESLAPAHAGADAKLRVAAQDDDGEHFARWDLDYDGTFDTEWLPLGEQAVPLGDAAPGAKIAVKVEVRDGQGNINGATTTLEVVEPAPVEEPEPGDAAADEGCLCRAAGHGAPAGGNVRPALAGALALALTFARRTRRRRSD